MALIIPQTVLTDDYQDFPIAANVIGGNLQVTVNPAEVQILSGGQGMVADVQPQVLGLGSYNMGRSPNGKPLAGIRARNAQPGLGAVLGGYFWTEADPVLSFIGLASSQAVGTVVIPRIELADFPPADPVDQQVVTLDVDETNGIEWLLQYRAATNDWEYIGGSPMYSQVGGDGTEQATASTAYTDLATVGPSVTVPVAGDYDVEFGCTGLTTNDRYAMAIRRGAAATVDADNVWASETGNQRTANARIIRMTGLAASTVLKAEYRITAVGNATFSKRWLSVRPVRLTP